MSITYHRNLEQCSDEWFALRCGIPTASTMKHIITPSKMQRARNEKSRAHVFELIAQRIAGYVDVSDFMSEDMERGHVDEIIACEIYTERYAPVEACGFITNDQWGFVLGFSPDGLVNDDGVIECKSRRHKFQIETILANEVPAEYAMQIQTGLLVTERDWCDFISYSAGLPMTIMRVYPDPVVQAAIVETVGAVEQEITAALGLYAERLAADGGRFVATDRRVKESDEITL